MDWFYCILHYGRMRCQKLNLSLVPNNEDTMYLIDIQGSLLVTTILPTRSEEYILPDGGTDLCQDTPVDHRHLSMMSASYPNLPPDGSAPVRNDI